MRWLCLLSLIPLGSCLIGIGDVDSDSNGTSTGGSAQGGSGASDASSGGKGATGGTGGSVTSGGASGSGGTSAGGTAGTSAGGSAGLGVDGGGGGGTDAGIGQLVFSDNFDTDLAKWKATGDGAWSVKGQKAYQSSATATAATLYALGVDLTDVRVVLTASGELSNDKGAAFEIVLRYKVSGDSYLHCNYQPQTPAIVLKSYSPSGGSVTYQLKALSFPTGFTSASPVTFEMSAIGDQVSCSVKEIPDSNIVHTITGFGNGTIGLKTWNQAALFDDVSVYKP